MNSLNSDVKDLNVPSLGLGIVVAGALLLRTLGRLSNPAYTQFSSVLADAAGDYNAASKALLSRYDFHFSAWPVDWDVKQQAGYVWDLLGVFVNVVSSGTSANH